MDKRNDLPKVLAAAWDTLFEYAPVMMHMIDASGRLVKVNRRWSETLGYQTGDVLGHQSIEFVTDESRARLIEDEYPLFADIGSPRTVKLRFVTRDDQPMNVLLDAVLVDSPGGGRVTCAALRDTDCVEQWEQLSTALSLLQDLAQVGRECESVPPEGRNEVVDPIPSPSSPEDPLAVALELAQDVSVSLRALPRVHEEWLERAVEQQKEMLHVAKNIEKSIRDFADVLARGQTGTE